MKNILFLLLFCLPVITLDAQDRQKELCQAYRVGVPPVVNGDFDDEAWTEGQWQGGLVQHEPYENRPPSQPTEFKICYDDVNLYVAIKALDNMPDSIVLIIDSG